VVVRADVAEAPEEDVAAQPEEPVVPQVVPL